MQFELDGTAEELVELKQMFTTARDPAVKERLEWTVEMLEIGCRRGLNFDSPDLCDFLD